MKCPKCQVDLSISDRDDDDDRWRGAERRSDYDRERYAHKRKSFWSELFD